MGDILYSSQASSIPFMTMQPNNYAMPFGVQNASHVYNAFTASIWNDREYIAGSNAELSPIASVDHQAADRVSEQGAVACVRSDFRYRLSPDNLHGSDRGGLQGQSNDFHATDWLRSD